ncbi:MAG: hypothetical protein H6722_01660 [Sandaracinus sp.]|nr:hypothetical protein [Sandaracinus sp.]
MRQFDALVPNRRRLVIASVFWLVGCGPRPEGQRPTTLAPAPEPTEEVTVAPLPDEAPPLGQLSDAVVPQRYRLALEVVPDRHGFHGVVEIDVQIAEATRRVWLHGERLAVASAVVRDSAGTEHVATYTEVHDDGVAQLVTETPLAAGEATIRVEYDAPFHRALRGLYRVDVGSSSYAFTQLEAVSARLVFPGFDEPRFKVPFEVTMKVRADDAAIFNTPETGREPAGEGMVNVRFEPTPPLPTYLLALAVGPLDVVEHEAIPATALRDRPIPLRGLAARGKGDELAYALQNTARIVVALEEYFGVAYPYAKLDIAAVPDFAAGAMENPGLITFRETLLLLGDGSNAPEGQKRAYAYVMAHELAHQWFGNLVTMQWWDDLWLNEAFATWMGGKITGQLWPAYRSDLSQVESTMSAMRTDSLVSARQIRQPIESNHDIRNAFDSITYRKGGAVLTMFERWMGEDVFRRGIQSYVRAHANGNATFEDLLSALSESAGRDVATSFRTFLFQPGLPFLETTVSCEGTPSVTVRQARFLPVGSTGETDRSWQLPVCLRWAAGRGAPQTTCALIESAEQSIPLEACPSWVHPNADGAGYFRFGLEPERLRVLWGGRAKLSERDRSRWRMACRLRTTQASLPRAITCESSKAFLRAAHGASGRAGADVGALAFARDELGRRAACSSRYQQRFCRGPLAIADATPADLMSWRRRRAGDPSRGGDFAPRSSSRRDASVRCRGRAACALAFWKLTADGSVDCGASTEPRRHSARGGRARGRR